MRQAIRLLPTLIVAFLAGCHQTTQTEVTSESPFRIEFDQDKDVRQETSTDAKGLQFTIKFTIVHNKGTGNMPGKDYKVVVEEDNREVARVDVPEPKVVEELSAVLTIDISGSMEKLISDKSKERRIDQAKKAANVFLDRLSPKAECGLILFDHQVLKEDTITPRLARKPLRDLIKNMEPRGGTAYLDAAKEGVHLLSGTKSDRKKVVVLMTDGVDLNSKTTLDEVIKEAKDRKIHFYTIGIGEPGRGEPVHSVLVLDRSLSMEEPADDKDTRNKITALREAASRFVGMLPESAKTTVLPFGSSLGTARKFTNDKTALTKDILDLKTEGETKMLDAAYDAICMLAADQDHKGKRAIVVMTDGIDNVSRLRPEDVIARAQKAKVTVHMLAFGREEELQQAMGDMKKIAKETDGTFHHARNEKDLIRIFEDMSNTLHDDGIDEPSLKRLAKETGGEYVAARDISKLQMQLEQISVQLQPKHYAVTFASPRGQDGQARKFKLKLVRGDQIVSVTEADTAVRGVVVAEMHPMVYLGLLGLLVVLATVPASLGRMFRSAA